MNEDVSKLFHCKESGCQMSFLTEQNLTVHHQSKHSKLNLEIPSKDTTINFSDQTPTPTRFLNKCEELRVFDDPYIQNLNPFDEGFRKAIDNRDDCGFLTATPSSNTDTLHTPQILPDFISRNVKDEKLIKNEPLPMQDEPENLSTTPDVITNIPKITLNESPIEKPQPIPLLPKPNIIYAATPILTATSAATTLHLNSINNNEVKSNESVKDRLKNIILNNNNSNGSSSSSSVDSKRIKLETDTNLNLPAILIQTVPLIAPGNLIINNTSKFKLTSNADAKPLESSRKNTTNKNDVENSTKRKSTTTNNKTDSAALKVERNRAAARRYRNKMKIQGQALREKYEKGQREIGQLKKEITELKKLLLLHKDCEVTKNLNLMN